MNLVGCKSPHHQLPGNGWLACPMHAEETKHVLLGCKSLGCSATIGRSGRNDLGGETWGPEHKEMAAVPKSEIRQKSLLTGKLRNLSPRGSWGGCARLRDYLRCRAQAARKSRITSLLRILCSYVLQRAVAYRSDHLSACIRSGRGDRRAGGTAGHKLPLGSFQTDPPTGLGKSSFSNLYGWRPGPPP